MTGAYNLVVKGEKEMIFMSLLMLTSGVLAYISEFFQAAFQPLTEALENLLQMF